MPILQPFSGEGWEIFLWRHEAGETFEDIALTAEETFRAEQYAPKKRLEFLMVRALLKAQKLGGQLRYHTTGRPFLAEDSRHISITHAYPFAAIGLSSKPLGLDLEHLHEKIRKVQERFLHSDEKIWLGAEPELESLTAIWSAKESLYKLDERHLYSFRNHYCLHPFLFEPGGSFRAEVFDEQNAQNYEGKMWQIENCLLTAAWEPKG